MGEYSVATTNRFALTIDEDEDLYELLKQKEEQKKKKEEAPAPEPVKSKTKGKDKKSKSSRVATSTSAKTAGPIEPKQQSNGPSNYYSRNDENRPPRFARQRNDDGNRDAFEQPNNQDSEGNRRFRGGMRGGFRGSRGMRGGSFGGRREFDRHSGSDKTGVKAVEKREGFGPHNWGNEVDAQLEAETQKVEEPTETTETENPDTSAVEPEPVEEVEPEPEQLTLEEYKAAQESNRMKNQFKVRKANEGADSKQWKGTVALQRKKKSEESSEEEYTDDDEELVSETKANLEKLNIEIQFSDSGRSMPRGRGGRGRFDGGRGRFDGQSRGSRGDRGRGGRGGGGFRGGRGGFQNRGQDRDGAPHVDNEEEFPTLGGR